MVDMEDFSKELLRCGSIITDDDFCTLRTEFIRIRVISYDNKIYYHKMIDGEVVEIKEIGNAEEIAMD